MYHDAYNENKDNINHTIRHDFIVNCDEAEMLFIQLDKSTFNTSQDIIVGIVYRPPNTNIDTFNKLIHEALSSINIKSNLVYVMGDFNIDLLKNDSHSQTTDFVNTMYSHSLLPNITKPT